MRDGFRAPLQVASAAALPYPFFVELMAGSRLMLLNTTHGYVEILRALDLCTERTGVDVRVICQEDRELTWDAWYGLEQAGVITRGTCTLSVCRAAEQLEAQQLAGHEIDEDGLIDLWGACIRWTLPGFCARRITAPALPAMGTGFI